MPAKPKPNRVNRKISLTLDAATLDRLDALVAANPEVYTLSAAARHLIRLGAEVEEQRRRKA